MIEDILDILEQYNHITYYQLYDKLPHYNPDDINKLLDDLDDKGIIVISYGTITY